MQSNRISASLARICAAGWIAIAMLPEARAENQGVALDAEALKFAVAAFEERCAICHEADGNSEDAKFNLVDEAWQHGSQLAEIEKTIRDGIPGTLMKPQSEHFTPEQIATLAKYVRFLGQGASEGEMSPPEPTAQPPATDQVPAPISIRIAPSGPTLWGPGAYQRFLVLGRFEDGIERDVTEACELSISHPALASVVGPARVVAHADGVTQLRAEIAGLAAQTELRIEDFGEPRPFSFQRKIGGILTKRGCNASDCHGGVKGRGGLKLSLSALDPREDHDWIVEGGVYQVLSPEPKGERVSRINLEEPEQSLLLLKPTMEVDHEGGKVLRKDSAEYDAILEWIRAGAPFDDDGAERLRIDRLEVLPREAVLAPDGGHQILVTAHLANGRSEDVTDQAHYKSNNKEVARVSREGRVQAGARGETDVLIHAAGRFATARFGVIEKTLEDYPDAPTNNFIDEHVFAKLHKYHIIPSEVSSDADFLRRVCLDLTGTLPPAHRAREFLADTDPDKRAKLIDVLLGTPEYVDYWVFRFSDLFRVRLGGGTNHGELYWYWVRNSIGTNKPYDQIARERLAAQGWGGPGRHFMWASKRRPLPALLAEDIKVFMGRRLDCSQCHNHPYETWTQNQFWGLASFYGRITATEWVSDQVLYDDPDGQEYDFGQDGKQTVEFKQVIHPRTKELVEPSFLDGAPLAAENRDDPRLALAEWVTSHPYFAEAIVNRMWGSFFGRGIVDPVDDFASTHQPSHPELLEALAEDFRRNGHDLKRLVKLIVNSRTYQLSSVPNETNEHDTINYSHAIPRALDAEVLLDAIVAVTGVPVVYDRSAGKVSGISVGKMPIGTRAVQLRDPVTWPSRFMDVYGRPTRQSVPERGGKPNVEQALHMIAGETYTEQLLKEGGRIDELTKKGASNRQVVEELYLAALCRYPSQAELAGIETLFGEQSKLASNSFFSQNPERREVIEDLLWALISSREFAYNH